MTIRSQLAWYWRWPLNLLALAAVGLVGEDRDRAALRHRLDDDHAGHDRAARKMAGEEPLVLPHLLARDDARAGLERGDLVQEEERVAVRQDLFDLLAPQGDGHAGVYSSSSVLRRARARWT